MLYLLDKGKNVAFPAAGVEIVKEDILFFVIFIWIPYLIRDITDNSYLQTQLIQWTSIQINPS